MLRTAKAHFTFIASFALITICTITAFAQLPVRFDLRDYDGVNYVTSVKDQQGGTCWTHGAYASMESNLMMTGNWALVGDTGEPNLAEYHLDWWNGFNEHNNDDIDPPYGSGLEVHNGGDYLITAAYLSRGEGAVRDIDAQWFDQAPPRYDSSYHYYYVNNIEWYTAGADLSNINLIKEKVMEYGVIGTSLLIGGFIDNINGNYIHYQPPDNPYDPNHAVAIAGWDDTLTTQAPLPGAWLIKNSWGDDYYNDGYFWISYYDKHCGQHPEMGAISFIDAELMPYDNIYYHDYHGWRNTKTDCSEAFNAFSSTSGSNGEVARAVSFYTAADSVNYNFIIYDRFEGGVLLDELCNQSGFIEFRGFHTVRLDLPLGIEYGNDFYIYLNLSNGGQAYDCTSDVPVLLGAKYRTTVESSGKSGESFYKDGAAWYDLHDFDSTANFCMKVLTTERIPLRIELPNGVPESNLRKTPTDILVNIENADETYIPGTGMLNYRFDDGSFVSIPLTELGGVEFQATLPGVDCDENPEFYFSAQGDEGHIVNCPGNAPDSVYTILVGTHVEIIDDNFETDLGWTVGGSASNGHWERGIPSGGGTFGDPTYDYDSSGQCYLTGNWFDNSDVDNGQTSLISPVLELSNSFKAVINYAVWYANFFNDGDNNNDIFRVFASNDNGNTWVQIDSLGPSSARGWNYRSIVINDFLEPSGQTVIRFEASDFGEASTVEAAIDAVSIVKYLCVPELNIATPDLPDWTEGIFYSQQLEYSGGYYPVNWNDKFGSLSSFGLSLSPSGLIEGTPSANGIVNFTAVATDDSLNSVEKMYEFNLNAPLDVLPDSTLECYSEIEFSYQMLSTGGTGNIIWSDKNNDLNGTGLSVSTEGLISGIPLDTGLITFTAYAYDAVGSYDEEICNIMVEIEYLCGDADDNESINLLDVTYLIAYLYKGGPPPIPIDAGNANGDGEINILDITYLINYLYKDGPDPICP